MKEEEPGLSSQDKQALDAIESQLEREFALPTEARGARRSSAYVPIAVCAAALVTALVAIVAFLDRAIDSRIVPSEGPVKRMAAPFPSAREDVADPSPGRTNPTGVHAPERRRVAAISRPTRPGSRTTDFTTVGVSARPAPPSGTGWRASGPARPEQTSRHDGAAPKTPCAGMASSASPGARPTVPRHSDQASLRASVALGGRSESIAPFVTSVSTREPRLVQAP